jgi:hypothetical protein
MARVGGEQARLRAAIQRRLEQGGRGIDRDIDQVRFRIEVPGDACRAAKIACSRQIAVLPSGSCDRWSLFGACQGQHSENGGQRQLWLLLLGWSVSWSSAR